jgi:hypothetical protein
MNPRTTVAIDGVSIVRPATTSARPAALHQFNRLTPVQATTKKQGRFKLPGLRTIVINVSIFILLVGAETQPFLLSRPWAVVAAYVVLAAVLKISSKKTFTIALIFLATIPLLYMFGLKPLAGVYATFAYLFLIVGIITAAVENRV